MSMKTTIWIDSKEVEELEALKLHLREPLGDVIHRLRVTKSSGVETDAYQNAVDRYKSFQEKEAERIKNFYEWELANKNSESADKVARLRRELGIDVKRGETTPALGDYKKKDEG